jgi:hypothetical protein
LTLPALAQTPEPTLYSVAPVIREFTLELTRGDFIGLVGGFGAVKSAKSNLVPIVGNSGNPSLAPDDLVNTFESAAVSAPTPGIGLVLLCSSKTQIGTYIAETIAVDMVDHFIGPNLASKHPRDYHPMKAGDRALSLVSKDASSRILRPYFAGGGTPPTERGEVFVAGINDSEPPSGQLNSNGIGFKVVGGSDLVVEASENSAARDAASFRLSVLRANDEIFTADGAGTRGILGHSDLLGSLVPADASNIASAFSLPHYTTVLAQNGTPVLTEEGNNEPSPTAAPTPEIEVTPEAEATDAAPVIEVTIEAPSDAVPSASYDAMLSSLTAIFLALIGVVGAVGGVGIWRAIGIILIVVEAWAKMTPSTKDDEEIAKWRKAYDEKMMTEAAKAGTQAAIGEAIGAEREKLVAKTLNFVPPADGPANG